MVKRQFVGLFMRIGDDDMYICDQCNSKNTYVKDFEYFFEINGKKYSVFGKRRYCRDCNSLVYDSELDNDILKKALHKKEEVLGIEPEKIVNLRKQYNLSQDDFSKIIGCAKKTLISYEKGTSIPNDIYLIAIKMLLDNPESIRLLLNSYKERFNEHEYSRINKRIELLDDQTTELSVFNGYKCYDINKIKDVIMYLTKDGMLKTKLMKELFYIDFLYFKDNTVSLTGSKYVKFPYGPVPKNYDDILETLEKNGEIDINYSLNGNYESFNIKSKNNKIKLEPEELYIIDKVKCFFENYSVKEIVNYSHKEEAFINTKDFEYVDYNYSDNIKID